jgi:flavin-dependent dehydrogenase
MQLDPEYDIAIVGGGLAGLAAAIQLKRKGHTVVLFEKEKYPFHKVCGEYVSLESWNFLQELGLPLADMELPLIDTLMLTAANGRSFTTRLPLGGFGISRYTLDRGLAEIALKSGVHLAAETKVNGISFDEKFRLEFQSKNIFPKTVRAAVCCAAYGKRSNLDVKWNRDFLQGHDKRLDNYVGIKYHIQTEWKKNLIGLHNFENGYCGISRIENGLYCLCYMTRAENLKKANNDIRRLEEEVLYKNPHLKKIFLESQTAPGFPVTISQISFKKKKQVEGHVLMLGDAAGMITPLCGNGMSIALHTARIASELISPFLEKKISRAQLESAYCLRWKKQFSGRLRTGRVLQGFFGSNQWNNLFVGTFRTFPFLAGPLIKMTHGKPF